MAWANAGVVETEVEGPVVDALTAVPAGSDGEEYRGNNRLSRNYL
jgi:hypothetical protein